MLTTLTTLLFFLNLKLTKQAITNTYASYGGTFGKFINEPAALWDTGCVNYSDLTPWNV